MAAPTEDPSEKLVRRRELVPDISDPTAGQIANMRELASEQIQMIADPAPLGLGAFALTTFLLSLFNAGVAPAAAEPVVLAVALAYGGIVQLLAGMWEFKKGNVFGATVFSSYGGFWISFWAYLTFFASEVPAELHGVAAGWFLICWGVFTVLMLIGAMRTTALLAVLFAIVAVALFLLAAGAMGAGTTFTRLGGWVGLLAGALAWYLCLAGVLASLFGRPVLPNRPLFRQRSEA